MMFDWETKLSLHFKILCALSVAHLVPVAVGLLLLNVHSQHLASKREALGLLNHLLVR